MTASIEQQLAWAGATALVVKAPERAVLEVTGPDRVTWLNGLLTCQLAHSKPGDTVLGLAVGQKGKIMSDVVVQLTDDRALVVVQARAIDAVVASFERHLMMEDAELHRSPLAAWFVHGPSSPELLARVRSTRDDVVGGDLDVTGFRGALVLGPSTDATRDALSDAAKQLGGGVGDPPGWEALRVLSGVAEFGQDFDESNYPQEASLESKAVSFDKGCYLGQEVVCMLEMRGHVKKKLVPLLVRSTDVPPRKTAVDDSGGASVGEITSAVRAADGEVRALAMVKYTLATKGTELAVLGHPARVL